MHLIQHGFLYDDCSICKLGDRDGIHWVDTERTYVVLGHRHRVLLCSSCIGDGIKALSVLIDDAGK